MFEGERWNGRLNGTKDMSCKMERSIDSGRWVGNGRVDGGKGIES